MPDVPITSLPVLLGRVFWTLVGPVFLTFSLYYMATAAAAG